MSLGDIDWSKLNGAPNEVSVGGSLNGNLQDIGVELPINISGGVDFNYDFEKHEKSLSWKVGAAAGVGIGGGADVSVGLGWDGGGESSTVGFETDFELKYNELPQFVQEEVTKDLWQYVPMAAGGALGSYWTVLSDVPIAQELEEFLKNADASLEIGFPFSGGVDISVGLGTEVGAAEVSGASIVTTFKQKL